MGPRWAPCTDVSARDDARRGSSQSRSSRRRCRTDGPRSRGRSWWSQPRDIADDTGYDPVGPCHSAASGLDLFARWTRGVNRATPRRDSAWPCAIRQEIRRSRGEQSRQLGVPAAPHSACAGVCPCYVVVTEALASSGPAHVPVWPDAYAIALTLPVPLGTGAVILRVPSALDTARAISSSPDTRQMTTAWSPLRPATSTSAVTEPGFAAVAGSPDRAIETATEHS